LANNERRNAIFNGLKQMVEIRRQQSAFSPYAPQTVLELDDRVFGLKRENEKTKEVVYCVVNVTPDDVTIETDISGEDLFTGKKVHKSLALSPYQYVWVKADR
jgi:sucrose phosphorylase